MFRLSGLGPLSIRQPSTRNKTHTNAHEPIHANEITEKTQSINERPAKPQTGTPIPHRPLILVFLVSQPLQPPMELLDQTEQHIKKVSYIIKHDNKEYIRIDFFEGRELIDTILRDRDGITINDAALLEEFTTFLEGKVWWRSAPTCL